MPRRKRRLARRARRCARQLLAFLFSNVGVIVLVVLYTIAGAFMFQAIEGAGEMERENHMMQERDNMAQYLWQNVTLTLNLFNETELKRRISVELQKYQGRVVVSVRRGWDGGRSSRQWSFSSAFLYSLTVITTIGYGHLAPRTRWGKAGTVLYALLGMPLFLLYLTNVGELLARWCKWLYAASRCRPCRRPQFQVEISEAESIERPPPRGCRGPEDYMSPYRSENHPIPPHRRPREYVSPYRRPENHNLSRRIEDFGPYRRQDCRNWSVGPRRWVPSEDDSPASSDFTYVTFDVQSITVPISVCVFIMVGYIISGSLIFGMWENWDQLDGAYFCFISLSSIGFGDFVPGERIYTARIETSFIVCSLYLMLGMALVAMCFNLMQEQVIHYVAGLKRALKRIMRCSKR